jgi:hypothetical protein
MPEWTRTPPTKPGWWGYRHMGSKANILEIVDWKDGGLACMVRSTWTAPEQMPGEWWSEPLTFPWETVEQLPCRKCGMRDSLAVKHLTRWPERDLCPVCAAGERSDENG